MLPVRLCKKIYWISFVIVCRVGVRANWKRGGDGHCSGPIERRHTEREGRAYGQAQGEHSSGVVEQSGIYYFGSVPAGRTR